MQNRRNPQANSGSQANQNRIIGQQVPQMMPGRG
jgi:hypothetical protein